MQHNELQIAKWPPCSKDERKLPEKAVPEKPVSSKLSKKPVAVFSGYTQSVYRNHCAHMHRPLISRKYGNTSRGLAGHLQLAPH